MHYTQRCADFTSCEGASQVLAKETATMPTIIPIPEDDDPDLFELPPGPAPEQLELFAEEDQKEVEPTMDSQTEN